MQTLVIADFSGLASLAGDLLIGDDASLTTFALNGLTQVTGGISISGIPPSTICAVKIVLLNNGLSGAASLPCP